MLLPFYVLLLYFVLLSSAEPSRADPRVPVIVARTNDPPKLRNAPSIPLNPTAPPFSVNLSPSIPLNPLAAPFNSQQQGAQASSTQSYNFNPHAAEFRPKPLVADVFPPPIAVGTLNPPPRKVQVVDLPHRRGTPDYMKADISKMKTAQELKLQPGRLYKIYQYTLGLKGGGKDHRVWVSVVYNGPVPDGTEKLAFVSLVWTQGELISFPKEYTEAAIDCFDEPSGKIVFISQAKIITKYTYVVWASSLRSSTKFKATLTLKDTELKKIYNYMVKDYKNKQMRLVTNRQDLGQLPLSKVMAKG